MDRGRAGSHSGMRRFLFRVHADAVTDRRAHALRDVRDRERDAGGGFDHLASHQPGRGTGFWVMRDIAQYRCGASFTTDQVSFNLGPNLPVSAGLPGLVNTGWSFVVR